MSRNRSWLFTLNNPDKDGPGFNAAMLEKADGSIQFVVFQLEEGDQKTPHFQGFIEFRNPRYFNSIRQWFPWHLEARKGTRAQALAYCTKAETRKGGPWYWPSKDFVEKACVDKQGKRSDLEGLLKLRRQGASEEKMLETYPGSFVRYRDSIEAAVLRVERYQAVPRVRVVVLWGDSGTGKSHAAFRPMLAGKHDAYVKDNTKWWDGYSGQTTIILDEFYDAEVSIRKFLTWCDKWPHSEQVKGGYCRPRYDTVILTTNQDPVTFYPNSPSYHAVQRRITDVVHYTGRYPNTQERVTRGDLSSIPYFK